MWVFVYSVNFRLYSGYHAEGYHARTDTFKLTGYHFCRVTTPELPRSIQTSGYRRVITPAGSFSYFSFHRLIRRCFHNNNHNFSTEPGAHSTDPLNTFPPSLAHTARTHSTANLPFPLALSRRPDTLKRKTLSSPISSCPARR